MTKYRRLGLRQRISFLVATESSSLWSPRQRAGFLLNAGGSRGPPSLRVSPFKILYIHTDYTHTHTRTVLL